jgi:exonuclease SbcC
VDEVGKEEKEQAKAWSQEKKFLSKVASVKKELEVLKKQIITQEQSVADAEKILDLEKSISKYEDDRQKLVTGQACFLCGSKEHPFAEGLECLGVSKSEMDLKERRGQLKIWMDAKAELDKKEHGLSISIDGLRQQTKAIAYELKGIVEKAKRLGIELNLDNICKVDSELKCVSENLKALDEKIQSVQDLQSQKNKLTKDYNEQHQSVELLKRTDATLKEKIKNALAEIDSKQKTVTSLTHLCTDLEDDLKRKLSRYNYAVPSAEDTMLFIETIQKEIVKYNNTQKDLAALKAETKVLESKLSHIDKQLATEAKTQSDYTKVISDSATHSSQLKTERIALLPIEITVENKRKSLIALGKQLSETCERSKKELQSLLDSQREKEAVRVENNK